MYEKILRQVRHVARAGQVYLSFHANEELAADDFVYADVINCLLTGEIISDQYDADRGEVKYELYGDSLNDDAIIITVYRLRTTDYDYSGFQLDATSCQ